MGLIFIRSAHLGLKRSVQCLHNFHALTKHQKTTAIEKQLANSTSKAFPLKTEAENLPVTRDSFPPPFPLPLWQRLGPVSGAINAYGRTQRKRPWATQLGTSLVIYFCGDMAAQSIGGEDYDPWRTARHLTIGFISSIPAYSWYTTYFRSSSRVKPLTRSKVHVPPSLVQLFLSPTLPLRQSRCQSDRVHPHFQQLLLRYAVATRW